MSGIDPSWMVRNGFGHSSLHWPGIQPNSTMSGVMDTHACCMTSFLADLLFNANTINNIIDNVIPILAIDDTINMPLSMPSIMPLPSKTL